jgi:3-methyl-2-oxobutanoate hydroxymethyltransferase
MTAETQLKRMTVPAFTARKGGEPLVCLTAYDAPTARMLDPHVDLLLVGDSLGMVVKGFYSTLQVTLDQMIEHGREVANDARHALVVVDMPFGSYEESPEQAFRSAARVMKETENLDKPGCSAIKLEGGEVMRDTIAFLVKRGIPVMAHVGLTPQAVNVLGGYGARGRTRKERKKIMADARAVAEAGAFAIVVENVYEPLAQEITKKIGIPVIGIGASPSCDGQILVINDVLGKTKHIPRFAKNYAYLGDDEVAVKAYADDVRARRFPGKEHCFGGSPKPK